MSEFVVKVSAEQYTGDIKKIKKFLDVKDAEFDASTKKLFVVQDPSLPNVKWVAVPGDYIVKTDLGFAVYKEAKFLDTFTPVEDVVKSIEVKEPVIVEEKVEQAPE